MREDTKAVIWELITIARKYEAESEEQDTILDVIAELRAMDLAVQTYLAATGHDLCHEQRADLANAFGLEAMVPKAPETVEEFDDGCKDYQRKSFGRAACDPPK